MANPEKIEVLVLNAEQLTKIEAQVRSSTLVTPQTTELQAGWQLGVQHVLNVLRTGWTR